MFKKSLPNKIKNRMILSQRKQHLKQKEKTILEFGTCATE
jgi:hypothetical protein